MGKPAPLCLYVVSWGPTRKGTTCCTPESVPDGGGLRLPCTVRRIWRAGYTEWARAAGRRAAGTLSRAYDSLPKLKPRGGDILPGSHFEFGNLCAVVVSQQARPLDAVILEVGFPGGRLDATNIVDAGAWRWSPALPLIIIRQLTGWGPIAKSVSVVKGGDFRSAQANWAGHRRRTRYAADHRRGWRAVQGAAPACRGGVDWQHRSPVNKAGPSAANRQGRQTICQLPSAYPLPNKRQLPHAPAAPAWASR